VIILLGYVRIGFLKMSVKFSFEIFHKLQKIVVVRYTVCLIVYVVSSIN